LGLKRKDVGNGQSPLPLSFASLLAKDRSCGVPQLRDPRFSTNGQRADRGRANARDHGLASRLAV
jgi:hypothetical protein